MPFEDADDVRVRHSRDQHLASGGQCERLQEQVESGTDRETGETFVFQKAGPGNLSLLPPPPSHPQAGQETEEEVADGDVDAVARVYY